jgi:hypothetical protein
MPIFDSLFIGNDLYVSGIFSQIDGQPANGVARWNGQSWTPIADVRGAALCLETDGTNLYLGGLFTNVSGVAVTNVAKWDGQTWSAFGSGLGSGTNSVFDNFVVALLWKDGSLYAGGKFTNSGPAQVRNLARWTGTAWSEFGGSVDGPVYALASGNGSDLYVGGNFKNAGTVPAQGIARWDGANWSPLGSGLVGNESAPAAFSGPVFTIALAGTNLYAGGSFTNAGGTQAVRLARWDGNNWNAMGSMNGDVERIRVSGTNVYIGGSFTQAGDLIVNHLALWDGSTFRGIGQPGRIEGAVFPGLRALATGFGRVYAGGLFTGIGRVRASRIACWDGTNWSALGSGVKGTNEGTGTAVNAIAVNSGGDVFAGGVFTNAGGVTTSSIARWDGHNWFPLGTGVPGVVSAIVTRGSDVYVGGTFQMNLGGGQFAFNVAKWNGSTWTNLPGGAFFGGVSTFTVSALAFQGTDLVLGGNFTAAPFGGTSSTNVVKHNGTDWVPLGNGVNSNVLSILVVGSDIYAGGRFTNASGVPVSRLAKWNGSAWTDLAGGVTGTGSFSVSALASVGTDIYAAGSFTNAGGVDVNRIAKWNGTGWSALGSGVTRSFGTASILALAAAGADLYTGGNFEYAGGKPSFYVGRWNETQDFDFVPGLHLSAPLRLPDGSFQFSLTSTGVPSYVIEASASLTNWTAIQTNTAASMSVQDSGAIGLPRRFYRARSGP